MQDFQKKTIKNLIGKAKLEEAFNILKEEIAEEKLDAFNELVIIECKYNLLDKKVRQGVSSDENMIRELMNVSTSLMSLINSIPTTETHQEIEENLDLSNVKEQEISSEEQLIKALNLLKQKKKAIEGKYSPSKKEYEEINKLEAEISELMPIRGSIANSSTRAVLTNLSVFFEEIVFSPKNLNQHSIEKVAAIRNNTTSKNSWVDRAVIVSALTLRIIRNKKVVPKEWNLLIDFLTDFEDEVWERALCGLILAFQYHQNKMGRYQDIMRRLKELRNTPKVQEGLTKIDFVLLNKTYLSGFISDKTYTQSFFTKDALNYFLPFYEDDNPVLEEAFENDSQGDIDHSDLIKNLKNLPYTNAHRYTLIQALSKGELQQVTLKGEAAHLFYQIFHISDALAPFQNIIQEYYCFTKYFPKKTAQNLFDKQKSISKTKLKDIILAEKEKLYLTARAAYKDKEYTTAIQSAKKGIDLDSSDIRMLRILADSWAKKKEYMNTALYLKAWLKLDPQNTSILEKLGFAYTNLKEYRNSLEIYKKARDLDLKNAIYWNNTGSAYADLKEYEKALENYEKARDLNPNNADYCNNTGSVYSKLKEHEKALENYKKARDLNPNNADYWYNIGSSYTSLKEYEKALENYEKARNLNPNDSDLLYNIIITYNRYGQYQKGLAYIEKLISLLKEEIKKVPQNIEKKEDLGWAYFINREFKKSEITIQEAISIKKQWRSLGQMGHIEFQKGNISKAIKFYKEAIDLNGNKEAFKVLYKADTVIMDALGLDSDAYLNILEKLLETIN